MTTLEQTRAAYLRTALIGTLVATAAHEAELRRIGATYRAAVAAAQVRHAAGTSD